jgi:hypothetical protein
MKSTLILSSLFLVVKDVLSSPCTSAQLQGDYNSFRITGGGGSYGAGSNQIVSYDHPSGSPVTSVTGVSIVPTVGNQVYTPTVNTGIPATFTVSAPDSAGSINLNIPANLPSGSFEFQLALDTNTGSCTLNSIPFTSTGGSGNQCVLGTSQCASSAGYLNCVSTANGNVYGGSLNVCTGGTSCTQSGSTAQCTLSNPNSCTLGNFRCSGTGFQQCYQSATGNSWTGDQACAQGTHCEQNGNSIVCTADAPTCTVSQCVSTSQFSVCSSGVLQTAQDCPAGTSCTGNGVCTLGSVGGTTCTPGYMQCVTTTSWQQCQQTASGGWQWGDENQCSSRTTCSTYLENYIVCS